MEVNPQSPTWSGVAREYPYDKDCQLVSLIREFRLVERYIGEAQAEGAIAEQGLTIHDIPTSLLEEVLMHLDELLELRKASRVR